MDPYQTLKGKILLRPEINLPEHTIEHLIQSGQLTTIPAITKQKFHYKCNRCTTTNRQHFARISCARCQTTHPYCRNCLRTGRVLFCEKLYLWAGRDAAWPEQTNPCHWEGSLTKHQLQAADAIQQAVRAPGQELLIWAVCGAGKTEMLFPGITAAIQQGKSICLATPRADVVRELYPRLKQAFPQTEIEALYGGTEIRTGKGQLVIATTHQLIRYYKAFDLMIIDELDAFPYHNDKNLHKLAARAKRRDATTIYLTATPRKKEKRRIAAKKLPVVFVPIRFHGHPLPVPQLKLDIQLQKKLKQSRPPKSLSAYIQSRAQERQFLLFVPTVEMLTKMEEMLTGFPLKFTTVFSEDPERKAKVNAFRDKEFDLLITTTILERGVTFPSIDVVILDAGHEVFDEAAIVQIAGRAGRSPEDPTGKVLLLHQGKTNAIVDAITQIKGMNRKGSQL
ncbi:competence protein ComFA [Gracilibacillus ureilyticus]|uniref:Competence protein ComFA n=1 Tax=Gracilibacillus ureilyticus TaxID=531814 RepID=A0A1H9NYK0_9BACI|nr:competence protein ComFA [Gracilibacillus ureilyticus]